MPRTIVAQAGIPLGFGYTALHAGVPLNEHDMDELARAGVELKGHEAFREWLGSDARDGDADSARTPSLAGILRGGGVWRLNFVTAKAEQSVLARIFGHPKLSQTSCAVLHGIMMDNCGYLDVKLRDDAGEQAVAAFPDIARANCRWVRDAAEILSRENTATTWCKDMRDDFAAALRRAIVGPEPPETATGSPLLNPELFRILLTIVEAGYTEFQGYAKQEYWIDFRAALRVRIDAIDPTPPVSAMREYLSAVEAARHNSNGADFMESLYEFYGLRLVAERRGWTPAQIMQPLPRIIRSAPWWRYERFTAAPNSP